MYKSAKSEESHGSPAAEPCDTGQNALWEMIPFNPDSAKVRIAKYTYCINTAQHT